MKTLLHASLYAHERSATGSIYGMLNRHPELFEKISPGHYRLVEEADNSLPSKRPHSAPLRGMIAT